MTLVRSSEIGEPRYRLTPPRWAWVLFGLSVAAILAFSLVVPLPGPGWRYGVMGFALIVVFRLGRNLSRPDFLVTLQANHDGLFFRMRQSGLYCFVPWEKVGVLEKTVYPVNGRGLRVEILGTLPDCLKHPDLQAEVRTDNGRNYVYTIPQLRDRDELIRTLSGFRSTR